MEIFKRLLKRSKENVEQPKNNISRNMGNDWESLPAFVVSDESEHERVSLIATAIAAGDHPNSQFVVKKIMKRNPEVRLVSLIAASLTAATINGSRLNVKSIAKKK